MLSRGTRGDHVGLVQGLMSEAGLYDGRMDNTFGPKTEAAVRQWQSHVGVPSTGVWDIATTARTQDFLSSWNQGNDAAPVVPTVPTYPAVQP